MPDRRRSICSPEITATEGSYKARESREKHCAIDVFTNPLSNRQIIRHYEFSIFKRRQCVLMTLTLRLIAVKRISTPWTPKRFTPPITMIYACFTRVTDYSCIKLRVGGLKYTTIPTYLMRNYTNIESCHYTDKMFSLSHVLVSSSPLYSYTL